LLRSPETRCLTLQVREEGIDMLHERHDELHSHFVVRSGVNHTVAHISQGH
jgi:hypothetical protein